MKTKTLEKYLLLEQSGELSTRKRRLLEACPEAQAKRDELTVLRAATPRSEVEPSPWAATKIAARLREERRPVVTFSKVCHSLRSLPRMRGASLASLGWKPIFLMAACLMLVVNTFNFKQTSTDSAVIAETEMDVWNNQFEEDLVELESLILAMSGDLVDSMEM